MVTRLPCHCYSCSLLFLFFLLLFGSPHHFMMYTHTRTHTHKPTQFIKLFCPMIERTFSTMHLDKTSLSVRSPPPNDQKQYSFPSIYAFTLAQSFSQYLHFVLLNTLKMWLLWSVWLFKTYGECGLSSFLCVLFLVSFYAVLTSNKINKYTNSTLFSLVVHIFRTLL